ncbi:hypothetical protein V6N13_018976 [Hibiscus sabdariffa]
MPHEHLPSSPAHPPIADFPESSHAWKRKTPGARLLADDLPSNSSAAEAEEQTSPQPTKRRRRYHVITTESDTNSSESPTF